MVTISLKIPESWNELNPRQLKQIALISHNSNHGLLFDFKIFFALVDSRWWQFFKLWKFWKVINNVGLSDLKAHYTWMNSDLNLTKFIPTIKAKSKTLHAPANRINNLTVDEFSHAEDLFLGWYNTKDFEYLQYLVATLYRELNSKGKRVNFDKTELETRAKKLENLDKKTLLGILLSYQGSRSYLIAQFPITFPKLNKKNKIPRKSGFGKLTLYFSGGKFGTYNETKSTNIYTFLSEFEEQLKQKPYA